MRQPCVRVCVCAREAGGAILSFCTRGYGDTVDGGLGGGRGSGGIAGGRAVRASRRSMRFGRTTNSPPLAPCLGRVPPPPVPNTVRRTFVSPLATARRRAARPFPSRRIHPTPLPPPSIPQRVTPPSPDLQEVRYIYTYIRILLAAPRGEARARWPM